VCVLRLLFALLMIFLVSFTFVHAKVTEEERADILQSLQEFEGDATRLNLLLAVINGKTDLSDEPALRQQILDAATAAGVDISRYPHLVQGAAPSLIAEPTTQEQGLIPSVSDTPVAPSTIPEQVSQTPPIQESLSEGGSATGTIILLIIILVVLALVGWWFKRKKR